MSEFVISLDFELLWGVRDHADRQGYGANIMGAREAIPRILDLFARHDISATWATVGFLFCESRDELIASLPPAELRPAYRDSKLSSYSYLDDVGANESRDPYSFAPSLLRLIAQAPGQEIGTHTLSHYYCLEAGQSGMQFEADLAAAIGLAKRHGVAIRSIVFPRNQYGEEHLQICLRHGITAFRGNPASWAYRPANGRGQTLLRRGLRLLDAHSGVLGAKTYVPEASAFSNVPASQFLRPCAGRLAQVHPLHLRTLMAGMSRAAKTGRGYHLWWHPHNFGANVEDNLKGLRRVLEHFRKLNVEHGMMARSMAQSVEAVARGAGEGER